MVDRTSTEISSWTLVEANDKRWARVKVLRTINRALEEAFEKSDKREQKLQKRKR
ncbi:Polyphosphate kinase 2 [compost metagenome]